MVDLETWDASGAFLKGFPFPEVEARLKAKGYTAPKRQVSIRPPANVWRHQRNMKDSNIHVPDNQTYWYVLELLKAMYGLDDGPLAWQLALAECFVQQRDAHQSVFDDCFFFLG